MRPLSANNGLQGSPLTLCDIIQRGYLSQVPVLVKLGIALDSRDSNLRTPLMLTTFVLPEEWGVGVARLLIEVGIRMTPRDRQGRTALHHACLHQRLQLMHVLLNAPDFNLAQMDRFGNTALHYAAMSGNAALVQLLASHYLRYRLPLDDRNHRHRTARDEAARRGHTHCADLLDQLTPGHAASTPDRDNSSSNNNNSILVVLSADSSSENLAADPGEPSGILLKKPGSSGLRRAHSANAATRRSDSRRSPRPSLPVISDGKSGDPMQKLFVLRDNRHPEDASTLPQKSCQKETIKVITSLEKPPSRLNARNPTVLRERTNLRSNSNANAALGVNNNNSSAHNKPSSPSPQLRRGYTFTAGASHSLSNHSLHPPEKDPDNIIHVASEHDFRNTREYVLRLTHLTPAPGNFDAEFCTPGVLPHTMSAAHTDDRSSVKLKSVFRGGSWRDSMRFLYQHYEHQWSSSWRKSADQPQPSPALLLVTDPREEGRDRKTRRSGSQLSELSTNSLSRLRKINATRRRISNVGLLAAVGRMAGPDPGRDTDISSPDTAAHGTCSTPLTLRTKQDTKATQRPSSENAASLNRPRQPADSTGRSSPSSDSGAKTFITHDQNNSDATSPGNGNAAIAAAERDDGRNFRPQPTLPVRRPYSHLAVPAVTASLVVDGNTDTEHVNTEPARIDTNRLYVVSDVDDNDDNDDDD